MKKMFIKKTRKHDITQFFYSKHVISQEFDVRP